MVVFFFTFDLCPSGSFVSSWVKYYCTYQREPRRVTMVTFDPRAAGKLVSSSSPVWRVGGGVKDD